MDFNSKVHDPEVLEVIEGLLDLCVQREKEIVDLTFELESLKLKIIDQIPQVSETIEEFDPYCGRKDILIADGAELQRQHLYKLLTAKGYDVVGMAKNSIEAMDLFFDSMPALVAIDAHLPGKDGYTTIKEIKDFDPDVKVIMLSRNRDRQKVLEAIMVGASDYICKPIEDERLLKSVQKLLAGSLDITE